MVTAQARARGTSDRQRLRLSLRGFGCYLLTSVAGGGYLGGYWPLMEATIKMAGELAPGWESSYGDNAVHANAPSTGPALWSGGGVGR
jgi:hypothetical protein